MGVSLEQCIMNEELLRETVNCLYKILRDNNIEYTISQYNTERLMDFMNLYYAISSAADMTVDIVEEMLNQAAINKIKLPQKKEKTQLDAVKEYLAVVANECDYNYHMQLWMPVLPDKMYLQEFSDFSQQCYKDGIWPQTCEEC